MTLTTERHVRKGPRREVNHGDCFYSGRDRQSVMISEGSTALERGCRSKGVDSLILLSLYS
jgi:hypothetical protein